MPRRSRVLLFVATASLCVGCDQVTKELAREALAGLGRVPLAYDLVHLELTRNTGGFLSLGAQLPGALRGVFFLLLAPLLLLAACLALFRAGSFGRVQILALGLFVGGGAANWLDRLFHDGAVTDFVSMGIGRLHTGVFNVADVAIMAGVGLFAFTGWGWTNPRGQAVHADSGSQRESLDS